MGSGDFFADMLEGLSHEMETGGFKRGGRAISKRKPRTGRITKVGRTTKVKKLKKKTTKKK